MIIYCSICKVEFDCRHSGFGREHRLCSRDCWDEFKHREILSILGKPYEPRKSKDV
jgi:hypothetical protein